MALARRSDLARESDNLAPRHNDLAASNKLIRVKGS